MPDDVAVYAAPIVLLPRGEVTAALAEMLEGDQLERAAALLVWTDVDVIVFACTSGSLVHGVGWDREVAGRIERASGRTATTTTAVLAALRVVGATSLAIATPYLEEINAIERRFLEESGFAVASIGGLGCATDAEIGRLEPWTPSPSWSGSIRRKPTRFSFPARISTVCRRSHRWSGNWTNQW